MAEDFNPDQYLAAQNTAPIQKALGPPVDPLQLQQFDPDAYLAGKSNAAAEKLQSQYGTLPQQALAGVEAFGRGASLGTSDILAAQLSSPEAVKARQEANPWTSTLGSMAGGAALIGGTGGLAAPIEAGLGGGLAATAAGFGTEGALFGAGNVVSDLALGDPNLNAQKILSDVGMSAAIGGGLGILSRSIAATPALLRGAKATEAAPIVAEAGAVKKPTSLEDMDTILKNAQQYGGQQDLLNLPQKAEAVDAISRLGPQMQIPVNDIQLQALDSPQAYRDYRTTLEALPGKDGERLRNWQIGQKKDLTRILDNTIEKEVAPGYTPTTNAAEAGENAANAFTDVIEGTRKELGPAFEQIKSTPLADMDHVTGVVDYLTGTASKYGNPKIANMFDKSGGEIAFKPYSTSMGIDQATYRAVKQAVTAMEENPKDFEQLFDIRKGLSQNVDTSKLGDAAKEISAAKASMMDYIQDTVQAHDPDLQVRDTFKKWAQNEENAQMIEKRFGAEIGSGNWRSLANGKADENILSKIFRDSDSVQAAKNILSPEKFNQLLADHLAILRDDATDNGAFSSNKFFSQMKRNQYPLDEAFQGNQNIQQKIKDALTLLRVFPDAVPQNPAGTAKTTIEAVSQMVKKNGWDLTKYLGDALEGVRAKSNEYQQHVELNQRMSQTADQTKKIGLIQTMIKRVNGTIKSGSEAIFSDTGKDTVRGAALGGIAHLTDAKYDEHVKQLKKFSSNPQTMMDHIAGNTEDLHNAAPSITQGIHTSFIQGVQYLSSKIPQAPQQFPLSQEWQPSQQQKSQFNTYFNAVNEPTSALKQVKSGSITNETMEALNAVHPQLLQEMRKAVISQMNPEDARDLPYSRKIALSKFLGQPMDGSLTPQGLMANQVALNSQLSAQAAPKQGRKTSLGGLKQLNVASRASTTTQQLKEE